jgi:Zn-dependent peptidase ImmA (M78 family)
LSRTDLAKQALEKSLEVREEYGYDFRSPLCVYELAEKASVTVRFIDDVSMEGVYAALAKPKILISSLRPSVRRVFTCAHELAHHFFGHGSTIDELQDEAASGEFQPNEFLANTFAGFLLMPVQGVKRAFSSRGLDITTATPEQIYGVACSFGVGYETLIGHLEYSLKLLGADRATILRKTKLPKIRAQILKSNTAGHLIVVDRHYLLATVDAEAGNDVEPGNLLLLPQDATSDDDQIELIERSPNGTLYRAVRPGLARATLPTNNSGIVVRVSRYQYAGLARYRHLEETPND